LRGGLGRRSRRHGLRHSSKRCANPRFKDVLLESTIFLLAGSRCGGLRSLAPSSAHGLVLPGASSTPSAGRGRKVGAHRDSLPANGWASEPFARFVSPVSAAHVETHASSLEVEDPMIDDKRANAWRRRSNPKRVRKPEASGVAPPLPPSQSHQRVANGSKTLRATPFSAPNVGRG
jgi:hypothetical protein